MSVWSIVRVRKGKARVRARALAAVPEGPAKGGGAKRPQDEVRDGCWLAAPQWGAEGSRAKGPQDEVREACCLAARPGRAEGGRAKRPHDEFAASLSTIVHDSRNHVFCSFLKPKALFLLFLRVSAAWASSGVLRSKKKSFCTIATHVRRHAE